MTNKQELIEPRSPTAARHAWHEAMHAHKIASLRRKTAKEEVEVSEQRIKNADTNGNLTGGARATMGDLGARLAKALAVLDEADAGVKRAAREVKVAWSAWQPFASEEAAEDGPVRIPRVSHLMEQARRIEAGTGKALPTGRDAPQGRADPTISLVIPAGSQATARKAAAASGVILEETGPGTFTAKAAKAKARTENLDRQKRLPHGCLYGSCPERFASKAEKDAHVQVCDRRTAAGAKAASARDRAARKTN